MHVKITLTRDEIDAILADYLRKKIPDLQEAKSGITAEVTVVVTVKEEANKKCRPSLNPTICR